VPLFGRIEDKYGVAVPPRGYPSRDDPVPQASRADDDTPRPARWRRIVRVVVFVLLLAAARPLFLQVTTVWEATASEVVQGVLLTLIVMAVVGSVGWLSRRVRRSPRTWWQATFTVPVMLITFVLGAGTHAARQQEGRNRATSEAATAAGTSVAALRTRQEATVRWFGAYLSALSAYAPLEATLSHIEALARKGHVDRQALQRAYDQGYSEARTLQRGFAALPTDDQQLVPANEDLGRAAAYEVAGWQDYAAGLRAGDIRRAEHGDAVRKKAKPYLLEAVRVGEAEYHRLGGSAAFRGRPDFEHLGEELERLRRAREGG